jgi:PKD repeat protein
MNKSTITLLLLLSCNFLNAQIDRYFWFAIPKENNTHGTISATYDVSFKITAMSLDAEVHILMPDNSAFTPISLHIPANTSQKAVLATSFAQFANFYANPGEIDGAPAPGITKNGILVVSTNDITVYYDYDNEWNRDLFSLKGKNALGTDFYTPFQNIWRNDDRFNPGTVPPTSNITARAEADIVATEDNTVVTIYPTVILEGRTNLSSFTITLPKKGDTYSIVANNRTAASHPAGTHITSDKPIAVTINDDSVNAADCWSTNACADIIGDQLIPTDNIGNQHVVICGTQSSQHATATITPNDILRAEQIFVTATKPGTNVTFYGVDGTALYSVTGLAAGQQAYFSPDITKVNQTSVYIESTVDKPIYVLHITGIGCEVGGAILPPINSCTGSNDVTVVPSKTCTTTGCVSNIGINLMIRIDPSLLGGFSDPNQPYNFFTLYNPSHPGGFQIPGSWFEANVGSGWAVLKAGNRDLSAIMDVNQANRFVNTMSFFHLGLANGTAGTAFKYGYFSSFSAAQPAVRIKSAEAQDFICCSGFQPTLVASGGLSYLWHYGTPSGPPTYLSNPTSAITDAIGLPVGDHNFYVEIINPKCFGRDTFKLFVKILANPIALFEVDKSTICAFESVHFTNQSQNANIYQWTKKIDNGPETIFTPVNNFNFSEVFNNTTTQAQLITYKLRVLNNQGCNDSISKLITVAPVNIPQTPVAFIASAYNLCDSAAPVQFTSITSTPISSYQWQFGDGSTSSEANPTHRFHNSTLRDTTYVVQLFVQSNGYCGYATDNILVHPFLDPAFTVNSVSNCAPFYAVITNNSRGGITKYSWTYGDGFPDNHSVKDTVHTFDNLTIATVTHAITLQVFSNGNCVLSKTQNIAVNPAVFANFSPGPGYAGCNPFPVKFINLSNMPIAQRFEWDFGDGVSEDSVAPSHIFQNTQPTDVGYAVKLTAFSHENCTDTFTNLIIVHSYIKAAINADPIEGCSPLTVQISNEQMDGISNYTWNYGFGAPDNSPGPIRNKIYSNTTTENLTYRVQLKVTNAAGCEDMTSKDILVYPQPLSKFVAEPSYLYFPDNRITITNETNPGSWNYLWTFGDGQTSMVQEPLNHEFASSGVYNVKLKTWSIHCSDSSSVRITVAPSALVAAFDMSPNGCAPLTVEFTDKSTFATSWKWNFGDGTTSIYQNPVHIFQNSTPNSIVYNVLLIVENSKNEVDSITKTITVCPSTHSGIQAEQSVNGVKMFPNPAKDIVYLKYSLKKSETVLIELIDPSGKLIQRITKSQAMGENTTPISIDTYQGHLLFIKAIVDGETAVFKVINE